jgi:hypothetical protein
MVGFCLALFISSFDTKFHRFKRASPQYHGNFAAACDSILSHYPSGTNRFVEVAVTDKSLPEIVSALHPAKIKLFITHYTLLRNPNILAPLPPSLRSYGGTSARRSRKV